MRVRASRRTLPDLVVLSAPDAVIHGWRPACRRGPPQHERAVDEHSVRLEGVDVGALALSEPLAVQEGRQPPAVLAGALRIEVSEEVPRSVRAVLGHQGRPLACKPGSDRRELGQLWTRRQRDIVNLEHVRPDHSAGNRDQGDETGDRLLVLEEQDAADHRRGDERR